MRVVNSTATAAAALLTLALAACSSGGDPPQIDVPPPAPAPPAPEAQPAPPPHAPPPSALFVLGDSLSDVGNAAAMVDYLLNVTIAPPTVGLCNAADVLAFMRRCDDLFYRQSRVSDGPVAVEHVAAHFGLATLEPSLHLLPNQARHGTVYAVAGAKARGVGDEDLKRQVDWLLVEHALLQADALYVLMIGGNDAIDALQANVASLGASPAPSGAIITAAVDAIGRQLERLVAFGARRVVVANVPDLGVLPAVRMTAQAGANEAQTLAAASAISAAFNRALDAKLDEIEAGVPWVATGATLRRFDLHAALNAARASLQARGANALDACFDTDLYRDGSGAPRVFHPQCAPAEAGGPPRFAEFAFFDGIHPTGATHAAIGDALRALL